MGMSCKCYLKSSKHARWVGCFKLFKASIMQQVREIPFSQMFLQAAVFLTLSAPKANRRVFRGGLDCTVLPSSALTPPAARSVAI